MEINGLSFILPPPPTPKYFGNVNKKGVISLSIKTANDFGINSTKGIQLAINSKDTSDKSVYAVILSEYDEKKSYKIKKIGGYHYILAKDFFNTAGIDYINYDITYTITEEQIGSVRVLKFTPKQKK